MPECPALAGPKNKRKVQVNLKGVVKKSFCSGKACPKDPASRGFSGFGGNLNSFEFQLLRWQQETDEQARPLQFWGFSTVPKGLHSRENSKLDYLRFLNGGEDGPDCHSGIKIFER